jgi:hypothetical protein
MKQVTKIIGTSRYKRCILHTEELRYRRCMIHTLGREKGCDHCSSIFWSFPHEEELPLPFSTDGSYSHWPHLHITCKKKDSLK